MFLYHQIRYFIAMPRILKNCVCWIMATYDSIPYSYGKPRASTIIEVSICFDLSTLIETQWCHSLDSDSEIIKLC